MGLDCHWTHPGWRNANGALDSNLVPMPDLSGPLQAHIGSAHDVVAFRGKVYEGFLEAVTGRHLHWHETPNSEVKTMAADLSTLNWEEAKEIRDNLESEFGDYGHPETKEEFNALVEMFEFYADRGASIASIW
jgi:hypothetical protein